jgi:hypothetical protein
MERQMQQRTFRKHQQPQDEKVKEAEAIVKTLFQAITEQDKMRVAAMAYTLYEQRGREEDGHDLDDWLEAERRIVSPGLYRGF